MEPNVDEEAPLLGAQDDSMVEMKVYQHKCLKFKPKKCFNPHTT